MTCWCWCESFQDIQDMGWAWLGLIRLSKLFHREHTGARRGLDPEELNVLCNSYQSGLSIAEVSICQVESTLSSLQKACLLTSFGRVCHMFHRFPTSWVHRILGLSFAADGLRLLVRDPDSIFASEMIKSTNPTISIHFNPSQSISIHFNPFHRFWGHVTSCD